jgi:peptidoglycan glycosyltransferase
MGMSLQAAQPLTTAVVLDATSGRLLDSRGLKVAGRLLAPPGSTLKPLLLASLLDSGKLRPNEVVACSGRLTLAGRSFACVHPRSSVPMDVTTAIAYSCNEYVARIAQRFTSKELRDALRRYGLASLSHLSEPETEGLIELAASGTRAQLQALGEEGVTITVLELATAYCRLAAKVPPLVLSGLEGAVEFGTAQNARIPGVQVAGKTGSSANGRWAWFAGFAPSVHPRFVVAVLTQGSSGGADAAPIAAGLLQAAMKRHA